MDIDERAYNINPSQVAGAMTERTRAIVPVHLYGQCAEMDPLIELSRQGCRRSRHSDLGYREGDFPVAERAAAETLALPIYPH